MTLHSKHLSLAFSIDALHLSNNSALLPIIIIIIILRRYYMLRFVSLSNKRRYIYIRPTRDDVILRSVVFECTSLYLAAHQRSYVSTTSSCGSMIVEIFVTVFSIRSL